jgi:hypothetical protein
VANLQARLLTAVLVVCATVRTSPTIADESANGIKTEFLMTLYAPLGASENINDSLSISNVDAKGGWVQGPRIKGVLISPGGDWSRTLTSGVLRLDVRLTIKTGDGALIYISYNGIERDSEVTEAKSKRGETLGPDDVKYWVIAPTFETSAAKYAWLNETQAVGKMVAYKDGPGGFVKYEIYTVR